MKIGLVSIVSVGVLWMLLETFAAYRGGWLFPSDVAAHWGKPGIAFSTHGGMYGDFLLPFLFAWMYVAYGETWNAEKIGTMLAIGLAVTLANHLLLIFTQVIPDPLGWKGERWSALIALHFVYMSVAVTFAGLFYFSPNVSVAAAVGVSILLGVHMLFGTHVPFGVLNRLHPMLDCPDFLSNAGLPWMQLGIWIMLAYFSWRAAGQEAGLWIGGIGIGVFTLIQLFIRFGPPAIRPYGG